METSELEERVSALELELREKEEALSNANRATNELRESKTSLEAALENLKREKTTFEERLTQAGESLREAAKCYRELLLKGSPDVLPDLVSGETIASVNESLEKARTLVGRVRQNLEAEISLNRVPAGAPARSAPDLSHLTPREKISYAVSVSGR